MIVIREACYDDSERLLKLTSLTPMAGKISILTDRRPDFFSLLKTRGRSITFIAEKERSAIGCFSASWSPVSINGKTEDVCYLADLKIHPDYSGTNVTAKLLSRMQSYLKETDTDIIFLTAVSDNSRVLPLFDGRLGFPRFTCAGTFSVLQLIPFSGVFSKEGSSSVCKMPINDEILLLYKEFYSRYSCAPVFSGENLDSSLNLCAFEGKELVAAISLSDVCSSKQDILVKLPASYRIAFAPVRILCNISGRMNLPAEGSPLRILYVKAFAFKRDHEVAFRKVLTYAMELASREKYHFLCAGIHEKDEMSMFFKRHLHFTFRSLGFIASLKGHTARIKDILKGPLYEDYSLV